MKKNYPEIRIKDAYLLRANASKHLHELWAKDGDTLADDKAMDKIVAAYKKAWQPKEKQIIQGMCDLYDIEFCQNIINVYIAPWFNAFSEPLVIGVRIKPDEFIDILTHELLHRLFTDNTSLPKVNNVLIKEWQKLFDKSLDFKTLVHVPVHAGLKAIYLDVLHEPKRLERDIAWSNKYVKKYGNAYKAAWDYVEEHDYKIINQKLKKSYADFKRSK